MIVHLDTSALIDALTGPRRSLDELVGLVDDGHRLTLSTIVLSEWWRGPRTNAELAAQQDLFPPEAAVSFGVEEASLAAQLYQSVPRARGREGGRWPLPPVRSPTVRRSGRSIPPSFGMCPTSG